MYSFTHTLEEVNQILLALGDKPFHEVAALIGKIHQSVHSQLPPQVTQNANISAAEAAAQGVASDNANNIAAQIN